MAKIYRERIIERTTEREVIEDWNDVKLPKKHRLNNGNFIVLFQKAVIEIAEKGVLTKNEMRLFLYLIGKTEISNEVKLPIIEISKALNEARSNIYTALVGLKNKNIAIWDKQLKTLRLNYDIAYKGKVKDFKAVQYKDEPLQLDKPKYKEQQLPFTD
jgi:hypothetical protein